MTGEPKQSVTSNPTELTDEDLVASAEEEKNYKGMCIAFVVIGCICSLIIISIILLTPDDGLKRVKYPRLRIEEIAAQVFQPKEFDAVWVSDDEFVYTEDNSIVLVNILNNKSRTLVPNNIIRQFNVKKFSVSADKKFILLIHNIEKITYYSYKARYKIYNISNEHIISLEVNGGNQALDYAEFGPKGNQMVYIFQNNIYYKSSVEDKASPIIKSGQPGIVYNGIPDWLYGERIWKTNRAFWWNPSGDKLSFASFDDSFVDTISFIKYGSYENTFNLMPEVVSLKYPKPGATNPSVTLFVTDLSTLDTRRLEQKDLKGDNYLTAVSWIDNQVLAAVWMTRHQNCSVIVICQEINGWICEQNYKTDDCSKESGIGWSEVFDPPLVTSDKSHYLIRLPEKNGKNNSFRQITLINRANGAEKFITHDDNDVTKILGFNSETNTVFYEASLAIAPSQRHIFSKSNIFSSKISEMSSTCLTCDQNERNCTYQTALFSPKARHFILKCLGMGIPWMEVRDINENQILFKSSSDDSLRFLLEYRAYPQLRTFRVPIGNFEANVQLILPPGLRETEEIKFPLVIEISAEPGEQNVNHRFDVEWGTYLASSRDFIYARIDVRGSRGSGDTVLHEMWHRIGNIEVNDYMKVIQYLKDKLNYVDHSRIALWGWSYGGYVAATSLALYDQKHFNCSLAVAPITNWLFWDSFTSERYLGFPSNAGGFTRYKNADLIQKAHKFKDKRLFLLHGTADDAVHLQHTFKLMKALNNAGVLYRSQIYPDSNHYLEDVKLHLYRSLETYLDECFGIEDHLESNNKKKNEDK